MKDQLQKFINDRILDYTKYVRNEDVKSISASQIGNDLLQNYLIALFPNEPQLSITQATFGSLTHGTMEQILRGNVFVQDNESEMNVYTEMACSAPLPNGWTVTGTVDMLLEGVTNRVIVDHKLTKVYAGKMFNQSSMSHQYTTQLNTYSYMFSRTDQLPTSMFLNMMYKDADPLKNESAQELIEVPAIPNDEMEQRLVNVTNELEAAIDSGELPPKCTNLWSRKVAKGPYAGTEIDSKCEFYCSQNKICPHFTSKLD